jgi:hypothetical protein
MGRQYTGPQGQLTPLVGYGASDSVESDPLAGAVSNLSVNNSAYASTILVNARAAFSLGGLTGGSANRELTLVNQSSFDGEILSEDSGSDEANRFAAAVPVFAAGTAVQLFYNTSLSRWIVSGTGSGGGGGDVDLTGAIRQTGVISPAALALGTTNNYEPTGIENASVIRISTNAGGSALSGIAAQPGGTVLTLVNLGAAGDLTLLDSDGGSSAANQFLLPDDLVIPAQMCAKIWYDETSTRWRLFA